MHLPGGNQCLKRSGQRSARHSSRSLADDENTGNAAVAQTETNVFRHDFMIEGDARALGRLDDLAPQSLSERGWRLTDLLHQVVRMIAAINITGGDLRH